jgi:hypothetical protein
MQIMYATAHGFIFLSNLMGSKLAEFLVVWLASDTPSDSGGSLDAALAVGWKRCYAGAYIASSTLSAFNVQAISP